MPFCAPRMSSGSAALRAASAAALSPALSASSTLRTDVRTRLVRSLLMTARRAATRVAFFAELVFAINHFLKLKPVDIRFNAKMPQAQ
jgi:hypothetical protein